MGREIKTGLSYDPYFYQMSVSKQIELVGETELRREYSKIRSIARKRVERIEEAGLGTKWTERFHREGMPSLPEIGDNLEKLNKALRDTSTYLQAKTSTITGQKQQMEATIRSFHDKGLDWINKNNLRDVQKWLAEMRSQNLDKIYGSEVVFQLYQYSRERDMTSSEAYDIFKVWKIEREKFDFQAQLHGWSAEDYAKAIAKKFEKVEGNKNYFKQDKSTARYMKKQKQIEKINKQRAKMNEQIAKKGFKQRKQRMLKTTRTESSTSISNKTRAIGARSKESKAELKATIKAETQKRKEAKLQKSVNEAVKNLIMINLKGNK